MDAKSLADIQRVLDAIPAQYKIPGFQPLSEVSRMLRSPDRKGELRELEAHLAALDRVVKKIVHAYFDGFTQSNKSYSQIIHHVSEAQERVTGLLSDMDKVQKSLQDHSQEVSALLRQKRQTEQMIRLLDKIAYLRSVPAKYQQLVAKKDYIEAAKLISGAMAQLIREDVLAVGTALVDLIQVVIDANFFELMLEELHEVIYGSQYSFTAVSQNIADSSDPDALDTLPEREEGDAAVAEAQQFVQTILKSLSIVGQLQDASLFLFEQVRPALKVIVDKEMADIVHSRRNAVSARSPRKKQETPLSELIDRVLGRFRHVLTAHYVITTELHSFASNTNADADGREQWREAYSANAVWSVIQDVTQELLSVHLRSSVLAGDNTPASATGAPAFRRRLFSFAASSAAFEYVEQDGAVLLPTIALICSDAYFFQAQPSNIVLIYPQVLHFHKDALHLLSKERPKPHDLRDILQSQSHLRPDASAFRLREYLETFVRSSFLPHVAEFHRTQAVRSIESGDAFKVRDRGPASAYREASRPLVLAVVASEEALRDLVAAMAAIPTCAIEFMQIAEQSITRLLARATSRSVEVMQSTESAKFLKVEANVAKMTADPAWRALKRRPMALGGGGSNAVRFESSELLEYEEEDMQSSVWNAWLTMPMLAAPDVGRLQHLSATLDSLEWLADRIDLEFAENQEHIREQLRNLQRGVSSATTLATTSFSLEPLTLKLRALSDQLLLMLRLEIGSMCFHYLGNVKQHNYAPDEPSSEPDSSVTDLCTQLRLCNELLMQNLPAAKRRYLLEPLPRLCCTLLVHLLGDINRINAHGVTQMSRNVFALQQALASLGTAREELFDRVRRYYELLNATEEDILAGIGATLSHSDLFTLKEYRRVLELAGGGAPKRLSERTLQKLQELLR